MEWSGGRQEPGKRGNKGKEEKRGEENGKILYTEWEKFLSTSWLALSNLFPRRFYAIAFAC